MDCVLISALETVLHFLTKIIECSPVPRSREHARALILIFPAVLGTLLMVYLSETFPYCAFYFSLPVFLPCPQSLALFFILNVLTHLCVSVIHNDSQLFYCQLRLFRMILVSAHLPSGKFCSGGPLTSNIIPNFQNTIICLKLVFLMFLICCWWEQSFHFQAITGLGVIWKKPKTI